MRGLSCSAPALTPGATFPMWASAPRARASAPSSLCGSGPRERHDTGTIPLPSSQLRSSVPETGRTGGSSPGQPGFSQSDRVDGTGTIGDEVLRSRGLWYGWDQNSLGVRPSLDAVSLDDLE